MNPLTSVAVQELMAAITSLLPPAVSPDLPSTIAVRPHRIGSVGLGGYVGLHDDPRGEIHGQRLVADVTVVVRATDRSALDAATGRVCQELVGADRSVLGGLGVLDLTLAETGEDERWEENGQDVLRRGLVFATVFEYLQLPTAPAGVIDTVALQLDLASTDRPAIRPVALDGRFADRFDVLDDATATVGAPSRWAFDEVAGMLRQDSGIRTPGPAPALPTGGTMLLLRSAPVGDLTLRIGLVPGSAGAIGAVFRVQGPDDYGYAALSRGPDLRLVGRKGGGAFTGFAGGLLDPRPGYTAARPARLAVSVHGMTVTVTVDDELALAGTDPDLPATGRVGLYAAGNDQAAFTSLELAEL